MAVAASIGHSRRTLSHAARTAIRHVDHEFSPDSSSSGSSQKSVCRAESFARHVWGSFDHMGGGGPVSEAGASVPVLL